MSSIIFIIFCASLLGCTLCNNGYTYHQAGYQSGYQPGYQSAYPSDVFEGKGSPIIFLCDLMYWFHVRVGVS